MTKRRTNYDSRAARARAARAHAGLQQPELADMLGISVRTLRKIEAGRRPISRMEAHAWALACHVPAEFLDQGFEAALAREVISRAVQREIEATVAAAVRYGRNGDRMLARIIDEPELSNGTPLEVGRD